MNGIVSDSPRASQRSNGVAPQAWIEANQRYLSAALAVIRLRLAGDADPAATAQAVRARDDAAAAMPAPAALDALRAAFDLTAFETDVLLLCAGVELDAQIAERWATAQGASAHRQPTFHGALASLPGAHWNAIAPYRPLRRFRLIEIGPGDALTARPLRIDERVLHYLVGVSGIDERLEGYLDPIERQGDLVPSHAALVDSIAACWSGATVRRLPAIELYGADLDSKRSIFADVCARLNLSPYALPAHALGHGGDEVTLSRLLTREAVLSATAVLVECDELEGSDAAHGAAVRRWIERIAAPLFVARRDRGAPLQRAAVVYDVSRPSKPEQLAVFGSSLHGPSGAPSADVERWIERVVAQFDMTAPAIRSACTMARGGELDEPRDAGRAIWDACRIQSRTRLDELAQRIDSSVTWDDLALPPTPMRMLEDIALRVRQRLRVYETWGFARKSRRGLGISALFSGSSGTGKTLAAEILANELRLDLHRIDLSQVVSKYIGETEKNLRRVFDAADQGASVLLFDEADALFGKRSDVKDSHDRYANVEVSYLLQRMEEYRGLAILTTNMRSALDHAFLRRLAFVVEFPFPDPAMRADIWRRVFPPETPVDKLDWERLARLNMSGGHIRNIALAAAFRAAEAGTPVDMSHVLSAAESEYAKLDRSSPRDLRP